MTPLIKRRWFQETAPAVIVGIGLLTLWQLVCVVSRTPVYVFPAPNAIGRSLWDNAGVLFPAMWNTLQIAVEALIGAVVLGVAAGFLFVQSRMIERSLFPYMVLLQVTPIISIAPLLIILFQSTSIALVICAMLVALFPMVSNTTLGLRSVDSGLLSYFRMNKIGRWQTLVRLRIPSALPFFLAGLRISSGLALIGAVVAEFVAGTGGEGAGLANQILQSSYQLDLPRMFAALLLITVSGLALFGATAALERFALANWHDQYRG